jgi:hypothetical protein
MYAAAIDRMDGVHVDAAHGVGKKTALWFVAVDVTHMQVFQGDEIKRARRLSCGSTFRTAAAV